MMNSFRDFGIDLPVHFSGDRKVICPQCSANRKKKGDPCLSVNGDKGVWHCHNCGWSGSLEQGHSGGTEQVYHLPEPIPAEEACNIDPRILEYFRRRGISRATLTEAKVFSTYHYLPATQEDTLCFAFPYYKEGKLINVKYRDANKNMAQEKNPEPCLWNIDACRNASTIAITEGEIDALSLMESGWRTAVSVDKGAPQVENKSVEKKLECVTRCMEILKAAQWVVICSDKDGPGLRLEKELLALLGPAKCKIARYPEGCKDLNDVLQRHGAQAVLDAVCKAEPAPVPGIHRFSEFSQAIWSTYFNGVPEKISTGWAELDQFFSMQPGSLNIITAAPASGKSEFANALMLNMSVNYGWKWGIFSPEMLPPENLFSNFAEKYVGTSFFGKGRMTKEHLKEAFSFIDAHIYPIVHDPLTKCNMENLLLMFRVLQERNGINGALIDPWNRMEGGVPAGKSKIDYIGEALQMAADFAKSTKLWIGIVAHPTKLKKDEKGQYPVATMYDISGSADFYNMADNGISLWRDQQGKSNIVQVHIQKVKNKYIGSSGNIVDLAWDRASGRFSTPHKYAETDAPEMPQVY